MHSKVEARGMASLFKRILSVYEDLQAIEKARAATRRDMARMQKEQERSEARAEQGWRVNP